MKSNNIDYLVPPTNVPCSQWENIDSRYHGLCKANQFGGAPSKGTCLLKCPHFITENPKFDRDQYKAYLTLYGYRVFEYPDKGFGDFVHWLIKKVTFGLVPMCAACSRRRAKLNRWWFKIMRKLTGAGHVGMTPEEKLFKWKPDARPPSNAVPDGQSAMDKMETFGNVDEIVRNPGEKVPCAPCEAKRRREEAARKAKEAREAKEQEDGSV